MKIVTKFGRLSGLQVQPNKSKLIFLNKAIELESYHGLPVLAQGATVRYLGYAVGTKSGNKGIVVALKKHPFRRYRDGGNRLVKLITTMLLKAQMRTWQEATMCQTPKEQWAHQNKLTDYQVWVAYRVASGQLNLYHEDRPQNNSCRRTKNCDNTKETLDHIFWNCRIAQACWNLCIGQWTGEIQNGVSRNRYVELCASRKAPQIPAIRKRLLQAFDPDEAEEMEKLWNRIWRIICTHLVLDQVLHDDLPRLSVFEAVGSASGRPISPIVVTDAGQLSGDGFTSTGNEARQKGLLQ
ncbi:RxLR effector protein [Phytophthora megakarya]|uniref:RxLR effector protein n=1 Tax=Phytophthora megakarya TaxID=4795 RepID=A0A225WC12_9STRA|nr:RxLR effector protein [Phytophthora megakarya]